jgi:UDP-N-acetylglucosamine--N-acetylmuramyl-(pentapeptide) pyrophosphoryl-undecaprenol N-acetylglucosamine transferase
MRPPHHRRRDTDLMTPQPETFTLVVAGGGTGGHTYPALTAIDAAHRQLAAQGVTLRPVWIGTAAGLEAPIAAEHGITFHAVTTGKFRRTRDLASIRRNLADIVRVPIGVIQAIGAVARARPDAVLTTGGYAAVPTGTAAWLLRRPLIVHEQITTLGLANRLLARLATAVAVSHPSTLDALPRRQRSRARVTGNPIRLQLLTGDPKQAHAAYGLDPALPLIYVTGGAQGSVQINRLVAGVLPTILRRCQIVHQCGQASLAEITAVRSQLPADLAARNTVLPYVGDELPHLLAAADLVISRAGAGTVAELTALGKASILIPLIPTGGDEQRRNARYLAAAGAAIDLAADQATSSRLADELLQLLDHPGRLKAMAKAASALGHPNAGHDLAALVINAKHP